MVRVMKTKDIAAFPSCFVSPYPQLAKVSRRLVAQLDYAVTIHQTTLIVSSMSYLIVSPVGTVYRHRGGCAKY